MIGHTDNTVVVDAPLDLAWRIANDLRRWTDLFSEYASVEILEESDDAATFRLTMHPDDNGRVWSWVSRREWDRSKGLVRARRVETGPFEFMNITWTFTETEPDRTEMRWVQDFWMRPDAPVDTEWMTANIDRNSKVQMKLVKEGIERCRHTVVARDDVASNTRRGGDLRTMLSPATVGSTSGFCGTVRLAPGESVSEHYHPYSEEYLVVATGTIRVDLDDEPSEVRAEQAIFVPRGVRHRLTNTGSSEVMIVFHLSPLAPEPRLGHVDTEPYPEQDGAQVWPEPAGSATS